MRALPAVSQLVPMADITNRWRHPPTDLSDILYMPYQVIINELKLTYKMIPICIAKPLILQMGRLRL